MSEPKVFSYTANRGAFMSLVITMLGAALLEGALIGFVVFIITPDALVRAAVVGGLILLYSSLSVLTLTPLWTKHRLSATHLHLRYGLLFSADLPREAIVAARAVLEKAGALQGGIRYDAKRRRVLAAFSERGQVVLDLDQPRRLRAGLFTQQMAEAILINLDEREEFLSALGLPAERERRSTPPAGEPPISRSTVHPHRETPAVVERAGAMEVAIQTEGLSRRYGDLLAVDNLSLTVRRGEIYGFLGSNGAGKTTTMKMLVGLLEPSAGRACIDGHDVWREPLVAKAALGYVADRAILYDRLTGREFLSFLAQMRGLPCQESEERIAELLTVLELSDDADRLCGGYSLGMKRKLGVAGALLHQPPVLIMDEPLSGLDPRSARRLKDLLVEIAAGGAAILLSTHDLATAEALCHRIGIIHRGRLMAEGSAAELRQLATAPDLETVFLSLTAEPEGVA